MTEFDLRRVLGQELDLPPVVEERLRSACAQAVRCPQKHGWTGRRVRTVLLAAAVLAALCVGAAAGYHVVRGERTADQGQALQSLFGEQGRPSTQAETRYDADGRMTLNLPNQERVPLDGEQALGQVGDYLPETGYIWQVGDYTLTVESYLLDEHTGTVRISYRLERPGGVEGIQVAPEDGEVWYDGSGVAIQFCTCTEGEWRPAGWRMYADQSRSTAESLCLTAALADGGGWHAEDGLRIKFLDLRRNAEGLGHRDKSLVALLELPGVESLPAVTACDPETREACVRVSPIGIRLEAGDIDEVRYIALEYSDGTRYVVSDDGKNLQNTEYALALGSRPEMELICCFNRLVDLEQVSAVVIDGQVYPIE